MNTKDEGFRSPGWVERLLEGEVGGRRWMNEGMFDDWDFGPAPAFAEKSHTPISKYSSSGRPQRPNLAAIVDHGNAGDSVGLGFGFRRLRSELADRIWTADDADGRGFRIPRGCCWFCF